MVSLTPAFPFQYCMQLNAKVSQGAIDSDVTSPIQFPALSKNLSSFPPTYIATCEFDPLRDDGKVLELALKKAGVRVRSDCYDGYPHYFWIFACLRDSEKFIKNVIAGVHFVLEV
jgi:versiconal hemiacetal acetate esterase